MIKGWSRGREQDLYRINNILTVNNTELNRVVGTALMIFFSYLAVGEYCEETWSTCAAISMLFVTTNKKNGKYMYFTMNL
jgi:hypothetical protein